MDYTQNHLLPFGQRHQVADLWPDQFPDKPFVFKDTRLRDVFAADNSGIRFGALFSKNLEKHHLVKFGTRRIHRPTRPSAPLSEQDQRELVHFAECVYGLMNEFTRPRLPGEPEIGIVAVLDRAARPILSVLQATAARLGVRLPRMVPVNISNSAHSVEGYLAMSPADKLVVRSMLASPEGTQINVLDEVEKSGATFEFARAFFDHHFPGRRIVTMSAFGSYHHNNPTWYKQKLEVPGGLDVKVGILEAPTPQLPAEQRVVTLDSLFLKSFPSIDDIRNAPDDPSHAVHLLNAHRSEFNRALAAFIREVTTSLSQARDIPTSTRSTANADVGWQMSAGGDL